MVKWCKPFLTLYPNLVHLHMQCPEKANKSISKNLWLLAMQLRVCILAPRMQGSLCSLLHSCMDWMNTHQHQFHSSIHRNQVHSDRCNSLFDPGMKKTGLGLTTITQNQNLFSVCLKNCNNCPSCLLTMQVPPFIQGVEAHSLMFV